MSADLKLERAARLRKAMADERFDALLVVGNAWRSDYLRYALDVTPMEGIALAWLPLQGEPIVWVDRPVEAQRIEAELAGESSGATVRWCSDPVEAVAAFLAERTRRGAGDSIGLAPGHTAPTRLAKAMSPDSMQRASAMLDSLMLRKSAAEADAVERVCALADAGYAAFCDAALVGRPEFELIAELESWFRARGCPENFMIMGSGGQEVRTMRPPGERRLQAGDLVTTELTPCLDGYYAQICRTLVIGPPSRSQLSAYEVYREALERGIDAVRPGATYGDVARAQNDVFRAHGLADYITSKYTRVRGHGVGLYVDGTHVLEGIDTVLEPNMTLIVHPNTYHPEAGYIVLGDVVRVTDDGCRVLTATSRDLATVPVRHAPQPARSH